MFRYSSLLSTVVVLTAAPLPAQERPAADAAGIEFFEKRIRPLLAEHCYQCHNAAKKRSGLVLESVAAMIKGGERGPALVPGDPEQSLIVRAVEQAGELKMPPKGKLSVQQIADVAAWVKKGAPAPKDNGAVAAGPTKEFDLAERRKHWAYQPVKAVPTPAVKEAAWCKSPVDYFILNGLEKAGLAPAAPAERRALIRRVTFDLIGLPPTPREVDAFLADTSPQAFAKVVDRLLASPHYGERWARHWLDLVRYAETLGFEFDYDLHNAWRYRDYVIRAFNADLPYDQFVIEHLAGDLLPRPRRHPSDGSNESILGTGFFWMGEARQTPVDIRQEQADVIDNQIDVLTKALLAQTVACARCHDHKFDAISTKDYYALVGYLKSSRYQQAFIDPTERTAGKLDELVSVQAAVREAISSEVAPQWLSELGQANLYLQAAAGQMANPRLDPARVKTWQQALKQIDTADVGHPLHAWLKLAGNEGETRATLRATLDAEVAKAARSLTAVSSFEDFRQPSFAGWHSSGDAFSRGPARPGDILIGESADRPVSQILSGGAHSGLLSSRLQGELRSRTFTLDKRYVHLRVAGKSARVNLVIDGNTLIMNPIYGGLTLPLKDSSGGETDVVWRTMPVDRWVGHRSFFEIVDSAIPMHRLNPPPSSARVPEGAHDGFVAVEKIVFSDDPNPPVILPNQNNLRALDLAKANDAAALAAAYQTLMIEEVKRWQAAAGGRAEFHSADEAFMLLNWLVKNGLLDSKRTDGRLDELLKKYRQLEAALPAPQRAPALADGTGEDEHVFLRGNYKTLGPLAPRSPPSALSQTLVPQSDPGSGRLHLAQALVDPSNPLLARVLVNRLWHHHFGQGLVHTPDDFGRMGQGPTHPDLLDSLATAFVQSGWSIKAMHRLMVLSSTYQMASQAPDAHDKLDPENRLLHRANIRRLEGEAIRDAVLAVSGRLDATMFGPSVLPYLTKHMEGRGRPQSGPLDGDGRRSIYLNVRRNFLTPMLVAFDYPTTFTTMGRRGLTTVPAQALTLMNDPFIAEQSERWAQRTLAKPAANAEERIDALYREAFARLPSEAERRNAIAFIQRHAGADVQQAWTDFCHVLFNVKEFIFLD
jgi:mono/diheme cytochrome c family protein